MNDRLTLNLGLRYDLVDGMPLDQSTNPNFAALQAAGGRTLRGTSPGSRTSARAAERQGQHPAARRPRLGRAAATAATSSAAAGASTPTSATPTPTCCSPAIDAAGGHGPVFFVNNAPGIRKPDGSFYHARRSDLERSRTRTRSNPALAPLFGQVASPRLEQPYTRQTNIGWAHQLDSTTALTVDYVRIDGRDINIRFRPNTASTAGRAAWPIWRSGRTRCRSAPRSARARAPTTG